MKDEQIILKPITTPEHPNPAEVRRYIRNNDGFYSYDYVFLEDTTWNALCHIACEKDCTVDDLCIDIDLNFSPGEPFASAARHYVLRLDADLGERASKARVVRNEVRSRSKISTTVVAPQCRD